MITRIRCSALLLAAFTTGCLGGPKPAPEYYTLSAPGGAAETTPLVARPGIGLVLGTVELPRYLDRPELVTRSGAHGLRVWNTVRWGGSLESDVQRALADDLARLLGTERIALYPAEARFSVNARILVELLELGSAPGQPVPLRARWTIAGPDGRAFAAGETALVQPVASGSWEDYVAAQRAALSAFARALAERIAALP